MNTIIPIFIPTPEPVCPKCGKPENKVEVCGRCGFKYPTNEPGWIGIMILIILFIIVIALGGALFLSLWNG